MLDKRATAKVIRNLTPTHESVYNHLSFYFQYGTEDSGTWYQTANSWSREVAAYYDLPIQSVVAIVAIISGLKHWTVNKTLTIRAIDDYLKNGQPIPRKTQKNKKTKTDGLTRYWVSSVADKKIIKILSKRVSDDTTLETIISNDPTSKTQNFYRNIMYYLNPDFVTVDTHMVRAALGFANIGYEVWASSLKTYKELITSVIMSMAAEHGTLPMNVQATIWTGYKFWFGSRA